MCLYVSPRTRPTNSQRFTYILSRRRAFDKENKGLGVVVSRAASWAQALGLPDDTRTAALPTLGFPEDHSLVTLRDVNSNIPADTISDFDAVLVTRSGEIVRWNDVTKPLENPEYKTHESFIGTSYNGRVLTDEDMVETLWSFTYNGRRYILSVEDPTVEEVGPLLIPNLVKEDTSVIYDNHNQFQVVTYHVS